MPREPWKISRKMFLSEDETAALLNYLAQQEQAAGEHAVWLAAVTDRVIVETLLFSGLRNSEFCQITVGDTAIGHKKSVLVVQETPRPSPWACPRPASQLGAQSGGRWCSGRSRSTNVRDTDGRSRRDRSW